VADLLVEPGAEGEGPLALHNDPFDSRRNTASQRGAACPGTKDAASLCAALRRDLPRGSARPPPRVVEAKVVGGGNAARLDAPGTVHRDGDPLRGRRHDGAAPGRQSDVVDDATERDEDEEEDRDTEEDDLYRLRRVGLLEERENLGAT
jgi:hypothetical protein